MFKKARIKLTAWYLLIIMLISVSFSTFIYGSINRELQRRFTNIERRIFIDDQIIKPPFQGQMYFAEDLQETRRNVVLILIYTNGVILAFSAVASYFLAGKTLVPIEKALNDQKRFVADASHELKTPLTALQTVTEVSLRDKKLNLKEAKGVLKSNLEEAKRLSKLAADLLKLTRYESGNGNFSFSKFDIKKSIEDTHKKILPIAEKKKIKFILNLKKTNIHANKDSIEELLTILIDNAVKFSKRNGKVYISLNKDHTFLTLKVEDEGIGIPRKDIPYIFDRFYRADQSRSKNEIDGFGLGLSMAKRIVELHKGKIEVESVLSKGSTFIVRLPLNS